MFSKLFVVAALSAALCGVPAFAQEAPEAPAPSAPAAPAATSAPAALPVTEVHIPQSAPAEPRDVNVRVETTTSAPEPARVNVYKTAQPGTNSKTSETRSTSIIQEPAPPADNTWVFITVGVVGLLALALFLVASSSRRSSSTSVRRTTTTSGGS